MLAGGPGPAGPEPRTASAAGGLGNTLDAIGDGTGDEDAFSSLEDWQAKLNNTARMVSVTCASYRN